MANALIEKQYVQDIADAIRSKNGLTTKYKPGQMDDAISAIDTDPSGDATATEGDIIAPKTAYVQGRKITRNNTKYI